MERENVGLYVCKSDWLQIIRVEFSEGSGPKMAGKKSGHVRIYKHSEALWEEESYIDELPANCYSLPGYARKLCIILQGTIFTSKVFKHHVTPIEASITYN